MANKKKILIVGPAWVGDMVMAQCLFTLLKKQDPAVVIDVLALGWSLPLLARMPEVAEAIVMPVGHGELALKKRYQLAKNLRDKHYDQAIVLPNSFKSALIPWWAHIPVRIGWRGEMRYGVLNDIRPLDKKRYPLMIEQFMALGLPPNAPLPTDYPLPKLEISLPNRESALSAHQLSATPTILALCPGAEFGPAKRWPPEHYAVIANDRLNAGWQVWLFGSLKDQPVTEQIMQLTQQRCVNLAGKTRLEEAIDLLSLATVVVSNDSGLMHVAAALHKPLIAVYGPTTSSFTPPLHSQAKIISQKLPCQPCFQRTCPLKHQQCLQDLLPAQVLTAMNDWVT